MTTETTDDYVNPGIVPRYSDEGYLLQQIPNSLYKEIIEWYLSNRDHIEPEPPDPDYINKSDVLFLTEELRNKLDEKIRPMVKEWVKEEIQLSGIYGIRIYKDGSWLKNHIDRPGHILSCILNIDQEVDEDWPLFLANHEGDVKYHFLEPGDLLLYESQLTHGREIPLKGQRYANIFIHYRPSSWV